MTQLDPVDIQPPPQQLQLRIGLDTDDNNLIDSFEIAAWSVPVQVPWMQPLIVQEFSGPQQHCHE